MIKTEDTSISGAIYSVTQLPARRALKLLAKISKIIGPASGEFMAGASSDNDEHFSKAIKLLLSEIDDKTFDVFVLEMLQGTRKNGVEITQSVFDMEFAGDLNTLFLVLKFVIEVNFRDFLEEGGIIKAS